MRMFPIQSQRGAAPHPLLIPWSIAELAYSVYAGEYGRGQSLERLAERGGFGPGEMDLFLPGWRERCEENARLKAALKAASDFIAINSRGRELVGLEAAVRDMVAATLAETTPK